MDHPADVTDRLIKEMKKGRMECKVNGKRSVIELLSIGGAHRPVIINKRKDGGRIWVFPTVVTFISNW